MRFGVVVANQDYSLLLWVVGSQVMGSAFLLVKVWEVLLLLTALLVLVAYQAFVLEVA